MANGRREFIDEGSGGELAVSLPEVKYDSAIERREVPNLNAATPALKPLLRFLNVQAQSS